MDCKPVWIGEYKTKPLFACEQCGRRSFGKTMDASSVPRHECGVVTVAAPPPPIPSLAKRLFTWSKAQVKHWRAGRPKASEEQIATRLAICESNVCGKYQAGQCLSCGCNCTDEESSWFNKLAMADQSCPLPEPLWERVDGD